MRGRAKCPFCGRERAVKNDGAFRAHKASPGDKKTYCPGSAYRPETEWHPMNGENSHMQQLDIIDVEVISETPGTELAVIPGPPALPGLLLGEALGKVGFDRDSAGRILWPNATAGAQLERAVAVVERLYPEMAAETGSERKFVFDPVLVKARTQDRLAVLT